MSMFSALRLLEDFEAVALSEGRLDARAVYSRQPQRLVERLACAEGLRVLDVRQCGLESATGRKGKSC